MKLDASIFKAYDIRGIYNQNLFPATATAIAKALTKLLNLKTIIVGRDCRLSGPALHDALLGGFLDCGVNVIDIGMVSTDMYYHACATKQLPGVMITASHNPKEYNGFKIVKNIPYLLSGDDGIQDIARIVEQGDLPQSAPIKGKLSTWDVMDSYLKKLLSLVDVSKFKSFKIIADTASGMVGPSLTKLIEHLPQIELLPLYFEPDGNFPFHGGDPLLKENRQELEAAVPAKKADLGFAFDPDGDRFFCIDQTGRFISGDFMTALLSKYFLDRVPGASIVYDIRASSAVPDLITANGGKPLSNKVGHAFIKRRMMEEKAVFGGEVSGHYYFADYYYCDSGLAPMLFLLDLLSRTDQTLSQLVDVLAGKYYISGELNTKGVDSAKVMALIESKYAQNSLETLHLDGLSMKFPDWNFNVRASNTEPLVRLNLEATSQTIMEQKRDEVLNLIRSS